MRRQLLAALAGLAALATAAGAHAQALSGAPSAPSASYTASYAGALPQTVQDKLDGRISILDFIPKAQWAAIKAGAISDTACTSSYDISAALRSAEYAVTNQSVPTADGTQAATAGPEIDFPAGCYYLAGPYSIKHSVILNGHSGMHSTGSSITQLVFAQGGPGFEVDAADSFLGAVGTITAATWNSSSSVTFTTTNALNIPVTGAQGAAVKFTVSGVTPSAYNKTYTVVSDGGTTLVGNPTTAFSSDPGAGTVFGKVTTTGGNGAILRNLTLSGGGNTTPDRVSHALSCFYPCEAHDLVILNWQGDAYHMASPVGSAEGPDGFEIDGGHVLNVGGYGVFGSGSNSNAGAIHGIDFHSTGGACEVEQGSSHHYDNECDGSMHSNLSIVTGSDSVQYQCIIEGTAASPPNPCNTTDPTSVAPTIWFPLGAIQSAVWSASNGGQVTFTTRYYFGLGVGATFTVTGMTPSGYNGTYTVTATASPNGFNSLTAALVSNPGTATAFGNIQNPTLTAPAWANNTVYLAGGGVIASVASTTAQFGPGEYQESNFLATGMSNVVNKNVALPGEWSASNFTPTSNFEGCLPFTGCYFTDGVGAYGQTVSLYGGYVSSGLGQKAGAQGDLLFFNNGLDASLWRWQFLTGNTQAIGGDDIVLSYSSVVPFFITGPNTLQQFGRNAAVPEVFEAVNFALGTGAAAGSPNARIWASGTAAPVSGYHAQGEMVFNTGSDATGTLLWYNTVAGTPGTWVAVPVAPLAAGASATAYTTNPFSPATSLTAVAMAGLAQTITPATGGRLMIMLTQTMANSSAAGNCSGRLYYGTGAAPAPFVTLTGAAISGTALTWTSATGTPVNGQTITGAGVTLSTLSAVTGGPGGGTATVSNSQSVGSETMTVYTAATGTALGATKQFASASANAKMPMTLNGIVTGLSVGTTYWIDEGIGAPGGTCTFSTIDLTSAEL